ncbi:MAG: hypothetical protein Q7U51_07955 [Methanoregula sp.]|nr:hypothetical protein [Methanoregula sp.]
MADKDIKSKMGSRYLLTFGAVPIDISKIDWEGSSKIKKAESSIMDGEPVNRDSAVLISEGSNIIYLDIIESIKKSPHVSNIQCIPNENVRIASISFGDGGRILRIFDPIRIDCNLPERLQPIETGIYHIVNPKVKIDSSSNFTLLFNGVIFAYFRPLSDIEGIPSGAIDARKLLQDIFIPKFSLIKTAHTPLNQYFIIHIEPDATLDKIISVENNGHIINIKTKNGLPDPDEFINYIYKMGLSNLEKYYSMMSKNIKVQLLEYEFSDLCETLLKKRSDALLLSSYHVFMHRRIVSEIEKLIQDFFKKYSKWSILSQGIKKDTISIKDGFDIPLDTIFEDLLNPVSNVQFPIKEHLEVIELAQKYVSEYKQAQGIWLTIIVSLISAIIGALIGVYFAKG